MVLYLSRGVAGSGVRDPNTQGLQRDQIEVQGYSLRW